MKIFEVQPIEADSTVIDADTFEVYKWLNVKVRMNFEAQPHPRAPLLTVQDMADSFASAMREAYLEFTRH